MIAGSSRSSSRSPNPVGRATSDLLHSLMLSIPGVKERVRFLTDFGVPLPEKREDDPEIYDFVRGKAPSPGALFQRLKDNLLPASYADMRSEGLGRAPAGEKGGRPGNLRFRSRKGAFARRPLPAAERQVAPGVLRRYGRGLRPNAGLLSRFRAHHPARVATEPELGARR